MRKYKEYLDEIEEVREKYKLRAGEVLLLQIAASFEVDELTYNKLLVQFCVQRDS